MGRPVGLRFFVRSLTGQPVREFGAGMRGPIVDALTDLTNSRRPTKLKCFPVKAFAGYLVLEVLKVDIYDTWCLCIKKGESLHMLHVEMSEQHMC